MVALAASWRLPRRLVAERRPPRPNRLSRERDRLPLAHRAGRLKAKAAVLWSAGHRDAADAFVQLAARLDRELAGVRDLDRHLIAEVARE